MKRNELLILTGMSGAGRSTVAHSLEDLGWYVVDNLPPSLLPALAKQSSDGELPALAVVVDVRGGQRGPRLRNGAARGDAPDDDGAHGACSCS